jgi:hypothetical protein
MATNINQKKYGFIVGLILPSNVLGALYFLQWRSFTVMEFFSINYQSGKLGAYLSIAVLINLLPFIIANQFRKTEFARGVFLMTLIYAVPLVILYFKSR